MGPTVELGWPRRALAVLGPAGFAGSRGCAPSRAGGRSSARASVDLGAELSGALRQLTWTSPTLEVMTLRVNTLRVSTVNPCAQCHKRSRSAALSSSRCPEAMTEIRIDELARRAGLTVDTIRFYQREGLLPPADAGRPGQGLRPGPPRPAGPDPRPPGPPVLARGDQGAARVRAPRPRRRHLLRRGVAPPTPSPTSSSARRSAELADPAARRRPAPRPGRVRPRRLRRHRPRRAARGRRAPAARRSPTTSSWSSPPSTSRGSSACRREVLDLFSGPPRARVGTPTSCKTFQDRPRRRAGELLPLVTRIVEYVHQRTLQRLTLGAIEREQQR